MESISKAAKAVVAQAKGLASQGSRFDAPALPASSAEAPRYFDRYCDIELPKLFSSFQVDGEPRAVVRPLGADERAALTARRDEISAGLQPYATWELDAVEAELAAMLGGFRSMRQQGDTAEGMVVVAAGVLRPFPLWAITKGCMKIAQREAGLNPAYAPNDTELFGVVEAVVKDYRKALATAESLLAAPVDASRALPAPRPDRASVEAKLGRPLQEPQAKPMRQGEGERKPDGNHAARVAAELAARKARREAGDLPSQQGGSP